MAEVQHSLSREQELKRLWSSQDSFATTLVLLAMDRYGSECAEWTPPALRMEIEEDFHVVLTMTLFDRLMAGLYLLASDAFYKNLPDFNDICNVLSGGSFHPQSFEPASAEDIAWGITEAFMLSPPDEEEENPFSEEIVAYIGQVLASEGIMRPPDVLRIATGLDQQMLSRVQADYTDDPAMFAAIWDMEQSKANDITEVIEVRLKAWILQLQDLPLQNGSTKKLVEGLSANFARRQTASA